MWRILNLTRGIPSPRFEHTAVVPVSERDPGARQEEADFIAVDDGGYFTYAPSGAALISDFEYIDQTLAIMDRNGNNYPLILDDRHRIALGRTHEQADFPWLRRAWTAVQDEHPDLYPLRRRIPDSDEEFLAMLFQVLPLLSGKPGPRPWCIIGSAQPVRLDTLAEVTDFLLNSSSNGDTLVDPYGHSYRPSRHTHRTLSITGRRFLTYTEIPASLP